MQRSKIIFLLFSLSITVCIYVIYGGSISKSQLIHTSSNLNNYVETDRQNINVNNIYYADDQLTISMDNTSIDESYNTTTMDNPHLPVAYKIKPRQADPELALENDDKNKVETPYLEEGQSRTFLYASTGINSANPEENKNIDEDKNSNNSYFLQPGQSRSFFAKPEQNNYITDEEGLLSH